MNLRRDGRPMRRKLASTMISSTELMLSSCAFAILKILKHDSSSAELVRRNPPAPDHVLRPWLRSFRSGPLRRSEYMLSAGCRRYDGSRRYFCEARHK